jgi:hypothetical protein
MKRNRMIILLITTVMLLMGCSVETPEVEGNVDADGFEGTWNITETWQGGDAYSCIELNRTESGWEGLFLHRGGHPQPAEIHVEGSELTVRRLSDDPSADSPDRPLPTIEGTYDAGVLAGTGTDSRGKAFEWTAVRAPDREEGSDRRVDWGEPIELFSGKDLDGWEVIGSRPNRWKAVEGELVNEDSGANIRSTAEFRDFRLHVEFRFPEGSNSGIYLRGRYETQVADLFGETPHNRSVGGIYGRLTPTVNLVKPAGEWNAVDVTLIGYRVTISVNGTTTIDGKLIPGITGGALDANETEPGPIMLQGDHGPVSYRNIVLTPAR